MCPLYPNALSHTQHLVPISSTTCHGPFGVLPTCIFPRTIPSVHLVAILNTFLKSHHSNPRKLTSTKRYFRSTFSCQSDSVTITDSGTEKIFKSPRCEILNTDRVTQNTSIGFPVSNALYLCIHRNRQTGV